MKDESVKNILQTKYGKQLNHIFGFYVKISYADSSPRKANMMTTKGMQLKGLNSLFTDFRVVPALLSSEDLNILYKHLIRYQKVDETEKIQTLKYADFVEAIVRIAVLVKDKLMGTKGLKTDSIDRRLKLPINSLDMNGVDSTLIEKMLLYMNISNETQSVKLNAYLNNIRSKSCNTVRTKQSMTLDYSDKNAYK